MPAGKSAPASGSFMSEFTIRVAVAVYVLGSDLIAKKPNTMMLVAITAIAFQWARSMTTIWATDIPCCAG